MWSLEKTVGLTFVIAGYAWSLDSNLDLGTFDKTVIKVTVE